MCALTTMWLAQWMPLHWLRARIRRHQPFNRDVQCDVASGVSFFSFHLRLPIIEDQNLNKPVFFHTELECRENLYEPKSTLILYLSCAPSSSASVSHISLTDLLRASLQVRHSALSLSHTVSVGSDCIFKKKHLLLIWQLCLEPTEILTKQRYSHQTIIVSATHYFLLPHTQKSASVFWLRWLTQSIPADYEPKFQQAIAF